MFSEKYKKMCEKAESLQKEWNPKEKDFILDKNTGLDQMISPADIKVILQNKEYFVWFPKEDLKYMSELQK